jgi:NADPH-dependent 7-cyano-7-deazaguanine reductase QueF-like protein
MMYEVIIGNYLDNSTDNCIVLSYEKLEKGNPTLEDFIGLDKENEYIIEVRCPKIYINSWNEQEYNKLDEIKNLLSNKA